MAGLERAERLEGRGGGRALQGRGAYNTKGAPQNLNFGGM